MTIKIKIRRQKEMETLKKKVAVTKTLDGELMFLTHPYITIIAKKEPYPKAHTHWAMEEFSKFSFCWSYWF